MNDIWITLGFFLFVATSTIAIGAVVLNRRREASEPAPLRGGATVGLRVDDSSLSRIFHLVGSLCPAARATNNPMRRQLAMAGYYDPSGLAILYGLRCATALAIAALFAFAGSVLHRGANIGLLPALGGAGFGFVLPAILLRRAIARRKRRLKRALPTALDLLVLSLEAGQALDQAILETCRGIYRSHPDLSAELQLTFLEARASNDRIAALRNLGTRTDEAEVRKAVALLIDADRFGGSIAPALRNHARYLRIRMKQQAQESARKVSVKLVFPVFFLIFPSVLLVTLGPAVIMISTQLGSVLSK